jgi:hypothetical protein
VNTTPISPTSRNGENDWLAPVAEVRIEDDKIEEEAQEDEITCGEEWEGRRPRMMANPRTPSRTEVDEHMATHIPYRAWCPHCVIGGGRDMQHFLKEAEEVATRGPQIAADYGFLSDRKESREESERKGLTPIMVMRDRGSGATLSMAVPSKGDEPAWVPQRCARWIDNLGHQSVTLKTDQEPSIRAWARAVARCRDAATVPECSPVGDSQSNGVAEQAVGEVKKIIATLKHALMTNIKKDIESGHAVMTWLVEYAGVLITRHKVKPDGRTGFEAVRGKRASVPICGFGEKILYLPAKTVAHREI